MTSGKKYSFSAFVGRLPTDATADDLRETFASCGKVVDIFIQPQPIDTLMTFGFVRFADLTSMRRAVKELNGWRIRGVPVRVEVADDCKGAANTAPTDAESREEWLESQLDGLDTNSMGALGSFVTAFTKFCEENPHLNAESMVRGIVKNPRMSSTPQLRPVSPKFLDFDAIDGIIDSLAIDAPRVKDACDGCEVEREQTESAMEDLTLRDERTSQSPESQGSSSPESVSAAQLLVKKPSDSAGEVGSRGLSRADRLKKLLAGNVTSPPAKRSSDSGGESDGKPRLLSPADRVKLLLGTGAAVRMKTGGSP